MEYNASVDEETVAGTPPSPKLHMTYIDAPVVLVVCVDLKVVASMDSGLDRIGVVSGASIYTFVWNILLAARNEGYGGRITTIPTIRPNPMPINKSVKTIPKTVTVKGMNCFQPKSYIFLNKAGLASL